MGDATRLVGPPRGTSCKTVVRWDGFEHGDSDCHIVLVFGVPLAEDESIMKEDNFTVYIFDCDQDRLSSSGDLIVPTEIWGYRKINAKERPGDGLDFPFSRSLEIRTGLTNQFPSTLKLIKRDTSRVTDMEK